MSDSIKRSAQVAVTLPSRWVTLIDLEEFCLEARRAGIDGSAPIRAAAVCGPLARVDRITVSSARTRKV